MNLLSSNLLLSLFTHAVQCDPAEMDIGQDEDVVDVFVLQEAVAKAKRQGVGDGGDVFELFGDLEDKAELVVEPRATRRTRATVVETLESARRATSSLTLQVYG